MSVPFKIIITDSIYTVEDPDIAMFSFILFKP